MVGVEQVRNQTKLTISEAVMDGVVRDGAVTDGVVADDAII